MPNFDDAESLNRVLRYARQAAETVSGRSRADLDTDKTLNWSLEDRVLKIGQAARKVSKETRAAHPEIPWKDIIGMRSRLVYRDTPKISEGRAKDILWQTLRDDVPQLIAALEKFVPPRGE